MAYFTRILPSPFMQLLDTYFICLKIGSWATFFKCPKLFSQVLIIDHFCGDEEARLQYNFYPLTKGCLHGTLCVLRFPKMNNFTCKVLVLLSYLILSFHAKVTFPRNFKTYVAHSVIFGGIQMNSSHPM
jgi:hypothetical protein